MKDNIKIICASIVSFILGSATVVCANQAIQAMQNTEIKVNVDGKIQEFRDEITNEKQYPITYNNRTYLPLRNIAELLGVSVDYDSLSKTAFLKSSSSVVYPNDDLLVQEKIRYKIANELEKTNPDYYNNNYFELAAKADINNDGKSEYIILVAPHSEDFNMRVFSYEGEELTNGLEQLDYIVDSLEVRKDNDKYVMLIEASFGDGLCYEANNVYEVELIDNKFQVKLLGRYVCDQDEEERKRAAIVHEDGSPSTLEEEYAAHTLKYIVNDEVVSKEEYEETIKNYKDIHVLVNKIK